MTILEARTIERDFFDKSIHTDEEEFLYTEAMNFLIEEEHNPKDMMHLGGYYYELRKFDLAAKYYEMASAFDIDEADECLGYIWYYGRTGERDYKKAFEHYSRSMNRGNIVSAYKVADMYKNGYYVEKDYDKYVSIIEELFEKISGSQNVFDPVPEIFTRLARIRKAQGRIDDAIMLYSNCRPYLAQRICYHPFFGNLNMMKWLTDDLYELIEFDEYNFDLFDLYYLLKTPNRVKFDYNYRTYTVESLEEDGAVVVRFGDKWYRDRDDFFAKATIGDERITALYFDIDNYVVC